MHLALDLSFTHTEGRWANEGSWVGRSFPDPAMYREIAVLAERGGIDLLFFGDGTGIPDTWQGSPDAAVRWGISWPRQDMSPYVAQMAAVTEHIGFGLTCSSTYDHPFTVARLLNSLDHVSGGRIAFNVVASGRIADAANHGFDGLPPHAERYDRMEEFVDVCRRLWGSVEPGVVVADRDTRQYGDPGRVHRLDHVGRYFSVRGPLNALPSPQGSPVLVQAGSSARGIATSATFADVVFAVGGHVPSQQAHRARLDEALTGLGRDPRRVGILWAVEVVLGRSAADARARREELLRGWSEEAVGVFLSYNSGYDFSRLPTGFRLQELADATVAEQGTQNGFVQRFLAESGGDREVTCTEFFDRARRWVSGYDHALAGTAADVADALEENFAATGARGGYMIGSPASTPGSIADVVELLAPELRRRGALAPRYPGRTLRENLLPRTP